MKVEDFDAAFPDRPWTYARGYHAAKTLIPTTATHLARKALGLPTEDIPRDAMLAAIDECVATNSFIAIEQGGEATRWLGPMAMSAAYLGDWDLVARCTGGKTLSTVIYATRAFRWDTQAFARHLASIVRAKAPAIKAAAAMNEMRDRFMQDKLSPDARIGVIAAGMFIRDLVVPDDVVAVTRGWLDGAEVELGPPVKTSAGVADGLDPRVVIFERYAAELGDVDAIDRDQDSVPPTSDDWSRDLERVRGQVDDIAIRAFVARRPMFTAWERIVDPIVAGWLGAPPSRAIEQRVRDLVKLRHGGSLKHERGWDDTVIALAVGNYEGVIRNTGRDMLDWKPGRFFKDDGRKLLRYLAQAISRSASVADVEPAWLDFLARRSPATTPRIEAGMLRWKHLLAIQAAITYGIGKAPRGTAGEALRRAIADAR